MIFATPQINAAGFRISELSILRATLSSVSSARSSSGKQFRPAKNRSSLRLISSYSSPARSLSWCRYRRKLSNSDELRECLQNPAILLFTGRPSGQSRRQLMKFSPPKSSERAQLVLKTLKLRRGARNQGLSSARIRMQAYFGLSGHSVAQRISTPGRALLHGESRLHADIGQSVRYANGHRENSRMNDFN